MSSSYQYQVLEQRLAQGIEEKRWRVGERLPSIRDLCREQGLSKATVQHALQRLEARGIVEARPKAGYFVSLRMDLVKSPETRAKISAPRPVGISDLLLDIMGRSAAFDLLPSAESPALPPGIVTLNRSVARALRRQEGGSYQYYDEPAGHLPLREQLSLHYSRRGWAADPAQICITSGCQHALFLSLLACCKKGDVVAVESPGFYGALQLLEQLELQVVEVPTSAETGMDIDALESVLQRWKITACILSPAFATPSGALMPLESKKQVLELAEQYDLAIIEDDINADTAFGAVPDPLKALDTENRVILCSSFSKSLSRDLRLGWVSGARWHAQILRLKLITQLASSRYLQQGVTDYMQDGSFSVHLRRQRKELRENRNRLIDMLRDWPCALQVSSPEGGLAVWVEIPGKTDTLKTYSDALEKGVVITPGPLFSVSGQFRNCLRISFAHRWDAQRVQALGCLPNLLF